MIKFSVREKEIGKKIFEKFKYGILNNFEWPIMTLKDLFRILDKKETALIHKILDTNPRDFGIAGEFFGINDIPKNLVVVKGQKYFISGETRTVKPQYLPENILSAFRAMDKKMREDVELSINIQSGYRSPAYQLIVFFDNLYKKKWSLKETLKVAALPGWSEHHGYPKKQATDIAPVKGIQGLENFYKTEEYKWLLKNAEKFGFFLSFPEGNKTGIKFEPWHWHYKK